jgi:transcriptional regulator with XRE-family HTH domain
MEFSRKFRELVAGELQRDVANKLQFTASRISQIMRGEKPSREFVERVIEVYGVDREEWLGYAGFGPKGPTDEREDLIRRTTEEVLRATSSAYQALSAASWFLAEYARIQHAHPHLFIPLPSLRGGIEGLTMEGAKDLIRLTEELIAEGKFGPRPLS